MEEGDLDGLWRGRDKSIEAFDVVLTVHRDITHNNQHDAVFIFNLFP